MGTYIIGDIHGCFDEWMELKNKIEAEDSQAEFILVGDIIDRGPKTLEMLKWAMENITPDGKYQMVIGNHESEKMFWLEEYFRNKEIMTGRGLNYNLHNMSADGYDFRDVCIANKISDQQLLEILNFFKSLPFYKERVVNIGNVNKRFIIVHATVPRQCLNKDGSFSKRSITEYKNSNIDKKVEVFSLKEKIVWDRFHRGYDDFPKTIIIHGHTPTISEEDFPPEENIGKIFYRYNDINVDCGIVYRLQGHKDGNLAALKLENLEEQYLYQPTEEVVRTSIKNKQWMLV
ncbi:MAG: metallophosphoesterase [Lachnospiraceae bacterium]|nr:metallophosphoesterase [Lachnospiraceae bacterium]